MGILEARGKWLSEREFNQLRKDNDFEYAGGKAIDCHNAVIFYHVNGKTITVNKDLFTNEYKIQ